MFNKIIKDFRYFSTVLKKNFIKFSAFFMLIVLLFKIADTHVYTHLDTSDQIENCSICDTFTENKNTDSVFPSTVSVQVNEPQAFVKKPFAKVQKAITSLDVHLYFFGRPPPQQV